MARKVLLFIFTLLIAGAGAAASSSLAQVLASRAFMAYLGVSFEPELTAHEEAIGTILWIGIAVFLVCLPLYAFFIWRQLRKQTPAAGQEPAHANALPLRSTDGTAKVGSDD